MVIVATRLVVISTAALGASPAASSARKFLLGNVLDDVPVHQRVLTVVPVDERRGRCRLGACPGCGRVSVAPGRQRRERRSP